MTYGLGVDLGTTFTSAAVNSGGQAQMLPLGNHTVVAPSVVFATPDGRLLTGDVAARRAPGTPGRASSEYKRRLGDPTPLILGDAPFAPVRLMAATLRDVVDVAVRTHGGPPATIVLTRPAVWGPYRQEQFAEVPRLAGVSDVTMVTEPVAAAAHHVAEQALPEGAVVAVYDLGGGTFDTAVLRAGGAGVHLLGDPEGVEWLGGCDLDDAILAHVDRELDGAVHALDPRNTEHALALYRLRQECTLAKEALSYDHETVVPVLLPRSHRTVRVTRAQFEEMARPLIASTVEALQRALLSADVKPADLSAVLLVGGSSRIPLVSTMVQEALDRPIVMDAHPKHGVALGAARIAEQVPAPTAGPPPARGTVAPSASPRAEKRFDRRAAENQTGTEAVSPGTRNQGTTNHGSTKKGTTKGTTNKGTADRATPKPGTAPRGTAGPVVPRSRSPWRRIVRLVLALLLAVAVLFAAAAIGTYYGSRQAGRAPVDGLGGFPQKHSPTAYFVPVR